ncbi:MAG: tRNA (adenosine(37)-N6)-threonylcarbamoyltransferase complex dimerization subunit type 1 TsaB, partial [Alphaproteobacteria bacterium]
MVTVLAIDTSQGACSAALLEGDVVRAHAFEVLGRGHAERLVPMVQDVMAAAGRGFSDLDLIGVTVGPGTFTGVRIGLAAARGFALAQGLPVAGVTSTEVVAEAVALAPEGDDLPPRLAVIHDARRGEVYIQLFERDDPEAPPHPSGDPEVVGCEHVTEYLPAGALAVAGTGVGLVGAAIAAANPEAVILTGFEYPDARYVAR